MKRLINKIESLCGSTGRSAAFLDTKFLVRWTNSPDIFETDAFAQLVQNKISHADIDGETGFSFSLKNVVYVIHVTPVCEKGVLAGYICRSRTKSDMCALVDQSGMLPAKLISLLKNDVNSIINISRLLSEKIENHESVEYSLLERQIEYGEKILIQYVNLSELIHEDDGDDEPKILDITELCENLCVKAQNELAKESISVKCRWSAEPCYIRAVPSKVTLMLLNVLQNAVRYSSDGESIKISISRSGGIVSLTCENTVDKECRDNESALGMTVIESVVKNIGGSYAVETENGRYRITISLPIVESETLTLSSSAASYKTDDSLLRLFIGAALSGRKNPNI